MDMIPDASPPRPLLAAMLTALAMVGGTGERLGRDLRPRRRSWSGRSPSRDIAGIGGQAKLLIKTSARRELIKYLDTAKAHGYKVIVYFNDTVNYNTGDGLHLEGQAVGRQGEEPSGPVRLPVGQGAGWFGVTVTEMRALYKAYKAADPKHPVIALFGDTPNFTTLPTSLRVEHERRQHAVGRLVSGDLQPRLHRHRSDELPEDPGLRRRPHPGTPIWLMVQGHRYDKGDKRSPTVDELTRQVRDGFTYLKANGIGFYTWNNLLYNRDFKRNTTLWGHAKTIVARVRGGTF